MRSRHGKSPVVCYLMWSCLGASPTQEFLIEKYRDEDAWNWHFRQPYCQQFMAAAEGILRERTRKLCELFGLPEEGS